MTPGNVYRWIDPQLCLLFCQVARQCSLLAPRGQCYKNTTLNYRGNFNPTFCGVRMTLKMTQG
jgi:hypothetical protein